MKCQNCGGETSDHRIFCQWCGKQARAQLQQPPEASVGRIPINLISELTSYKPMAGGAIALTLSILGMLSVISIAWFANAIGTPLPDILNGFMTGSFICGCIAIPLSSFAFLRRHHTVAATGSFFSIVAAWGSFGIFTMAIAVVGFILILTSRDEFD